MDLVRSLDWAATPLGALDDWPEPLRTTTNLLLAARFPMALLWSPELIFIYNDGYRLIAGERHPAALGRSTRAVWPEVWHLNEPIFQAVMARGETVYLEDALFPINRGGALEDAYFTLCYSPVRLGDGTIGGTLVTLQETTAVVRERQATREALRESTALLRAISDSSPDVIFAKDRAGRLRFANPATLALIGKPEGQVLGRTDAEFLEDQEAARQVMANDRRVMESGVAQEFEERVARPDGTQVVWASRKVPYRGEDGGVIGLLGVSRDVTERTRTLEALRESEERFRLLISHAPAAIAMFDREMRYLAHSRRFLADNELGTQSLVGRSHYEVFPGLPERWKAIHRRCLAGASERSDEEAFPHADGRTDWRRWEIVPWHRVDGAIGGVVLFSEDITRQKEASLALTEQLERQRLIEADLRASEARTREAVHALEAALDVTRKTQDKLRQAQKMEAIGQLAGGVAHDFNNLLTVILGNTESVLAAASGSDAIREHAGEILQAAERAAALTRQLLAFSRKQVLEPRVVEVNALLAGLERMLRRLIGEDIEIRLLLEPSVHPCRIDPGQFEQALVNLVVNARDAMRDGGRLTIETANVHLDQAYVDEHPEARVGDYVRVTVSDNGVGMSREVREHLFEPFFTTKGIGQGTGLGLSTVHGIVHQSGGTIWVYSEPGQGTTFKLYFPRADQAELGLLAPPRASAPAARGQETILLAEDEAQVRGTIARTLRKAGYHVLEASNGGEALLICEQHGGRIDLLLTDVVMPKLNGRKVAERLRALRPELKVLFMSGYTENAIVHHGVLDAGLDFLPKPVTRGPLLEKVRELLDRGRPEEGG